MVDRVTNACSHGKTWCQWCHAGGDSAPVLPEEQRPLPPLDELMRED